MTPTASFPDLSFFPFFSSHDKALFFSAAEMYHVPEGEILLPEAGKSCCYILVRGGGRLFTGRKERTVGSGSWFGARPFYGGGAFSKFIAHFASDIAIIPAARFAEMLMSNFIWYRGYCNVLRFSADSALYSGEHHSCEIVSVTGKAGSGKTAFISAFVLSRIPGKRVLVIHVSGKPPALLLHLFKPGAATDDIPQLELPVTPARFEAALVTVDDRISLITLNSIRKENFDGCINSLIQFYYSRFDYIIIEFNCDDENAHAISGLSDSLYYIHESGKEKKYFDLFVKQNLQRGQCSFLVANGFGAVPENRLMMKKLPVLDRESLSMMLVSGELTNIAPRSCLIVKPSLFSAIHLNKYISENFEDFQWSMVSSSLYSSVVLWFYAISGTLVEFRHLMRKFFEPQMQNILFSVRYPDKALYSSRYLSSFFHALSKRRVQRSLQLAYGLTDTFGEQLLLNGSSAEYSAAAATLYPWTAPLNGREKMGGYSSQSAGSSAVFRSITLNLHDCAFLSVNSTYPVSCGLPTVTEQVALSFDKGYNNDMLRNIVIDVKGGIYNIREDL